MVTSIVASSGSAVASGDVALHLQESLLDLATWQPLGCEVQAFLIGLHRLIGATFLGQDGALNPIPQGVEWPMAAWRASTSESSALQHVYRLQKWMPLPPGKQTYKHLLFRNIAHEHANSIFGVFRNVITFALYTKYFTRMQFFSLFVWSALGQT